LSPENIFDQEAVAVVFPLVHGLMAGAATVARNNLATRAKALVLCVASAHCEASAFADHLIGSNCSMNCPSQVTRVARQPSALGVSLTS
jgi:hypothetical protein